MLKKTLLGALVLLIAIAPLSMSGSAMATTVSNLIVNPSVEESTDGLSPNGWGTASWGVNTSVFSYTNSAKSGGRSLEVRTTGYTDGASNWYFAPVSVTAGKTYEYSNWYKSDVDTALNAEITMNDGNKSYVWLTNLSTSTDWTLAKTTITAPANSKSITIFQTLTKVGYILSDDFTFGEYEVAGFSRGLVSVVFDDGWTNQYENAYPVLKRLGFNATYYIISGELKSQPQYMSVSQVADLSANGDEIGSHSVTHADLTTLGNADLTAELQNSRLALEEILNGKQVTNFAYPLGAYNSATIAVGKSIYRSQRTVERGFNTPDNFDITKLKIQEVDSVNTVPEVQGWINEAVANRTWLILLYHEIANVPAYPEDAYYTVSPQDFTSAMEYLKSTGVMVKTVNQALDEIEPQIGTITPTPPTVVYKPGDLNKDNVVDALDLSTLLVNWNKSGVGATQGDLNADGIVDALDLSTLLVNWSK